MTSGKALVAAVLLVLSASSLIDAFTQPTMMTQQVFSCKSMAYPLQTLRLSSANEEEEESDNNNPDADKFLDKAQQLRAQIRQMESPIGDDRRARYVEKMENDNNNNNDDDDATTPKKKS